MCSFNFFLFSIGFIYFLSALLLCLLRQSAFFLPSPFLCPHPVSENTITLAAPAAADADALNSISARCCSVREGGVGRRGGTGTARWSGRKREIVRKGWEVWVVHSRLTHSRLPPPFFLSLKDIIIGARCTSTHHDMASISFSASGSSRDEYILTRSDRRTGSNTEELVLEQLPLRLE